MTTFEQALQDQKSLAEELTSVALEWLESKDPKHPGHVQGANYAAWEHILRAKHDSHKVGLFNAYRKFSRFDGGIYY